MTSAIKQGLEGFIKNNSKKISSLSFDPDDFMENIMQRTRSLSLDERTKLTWNLYLSYILASQPEYFKIKIFTRPEDTLYIVYPWINGEEKVLTSFDRYNKDVAQAKTDVLTTIKQTLQLTPDNLAKVERLINAADVEVID